MRKLILTLLTGFSLLAASGQEDTRDSLLKALQHPADDTDKLFTLCRLGNAFMYSDLNQAMKYTTKAVAVADAMQFKKGQAQANNLLGNLAFEAGDYVYALQTHLRVLSINDSLADSTGIAASYNNIARVYQQQGDFETAVINFQRSVAIFRNQNDSLFLLQSLMSLGDNYEKMNEVQMALRYQQEAYLVALTLKDTLNMAPVLANLGNIHSKLGNHDLALQHYRISIPYGIIADDKQSLSDACYGMSLEYTKRQQKDSAIKFGKLALDYAMSNSYRAGAKDAASHLAHLYDSLNVLDKARVYQKMADSLRNLLFNSDIVRQVTRLKLEEDLRQEKQEVAREEAALARMNLIQLYGIAAFIALFLVVLLLASRRKVKHWSMRYLGLLALILIFELINVLIHPLIIKYSHHVLITELIISVVIGSLLFPLNQALEHWMEKRMLNPKRRGRPKKGSVHKQIAPVKGDDLSAGQ